MQFILIQLADSSKYKYEIHLHSLKEKYVALITFDIFIIYSFT